MQICIGMASKIFQVKRLRRPGFCMVWQGHLAGMTRPSNVPKELNSVFWLRYGMTWNLYGINPWKNKTWALPKRTASAKSLSFVPPMLLNFWSKQIALVSWINWCPMLPPTALVFQKRFGSIPWLRKSCLIDVGTSTVGVWIVQEFLCVGWPSHHAAQGSHYLCARRHPGGLPSDLRRNMKKPKQALVISEFLPFFYRFLNIVGCTWVYWYCSLLYSMHFWPRSQKSMVRDIYASCY